MSYIVLDVIGCWPGMGETWPISAVQFADGWAYCDAKYRGVAGFRISRDGFVYALFSCGTLRRFKRDTKPRKTYMGYHKF